jgi:hypothetical protein
VPVVMSIPLALVGRGEDCDFQLNHDRVADMACILALTNGLLLLRDLNTGSIRVNGQLVRRAVLLNNNVLSIAGIQFQVCREEESDE